MRNWFRTKTVALPIPTEPEMYIIMAGIIMFIMWMVIDG